MADHFITQNWYITGLVGKLFVVLEQRGLLEFADALDGNDTNKTNILDDLEAEDKDEDNKEVDKPPPPPFPGPGQDPSRPPPPPYPGQQKVRFGFQHEI